MHFQRDKLWTKQGFALDKNTPTASNIAILVEALKRADNNDYAIIVLLQRDHQFYQYATTHEGYVTEIPALQR